MKALLSACGTLAILVAGIGGLHATVIDFDNLPGGGVLAPNTILTTQYASVGVTFSATENGGPVGAAVINGPLTFDGNNWANTTTSGFGPRHDVLIIAFAAPVNNVSWLLQSYGVGTITFNAYDSGNNLIETLLATGNFTVTAFTVAGISRIEALQPGDDWGWAMDNLEFESQVPEPGTFALAALGMAALALFRHKRERS